MKITREDAIKIIQNVTDRDDPYWDNLTEDYYDEETDTWPSLEDVFVALGVSKDELESTGFYGSHTKCFLCDLKDKSCCENSECPELS